MKNKKIISIIALSGVLAMNGQVVTPIINNKVLTNHSRKLDNTNQKNIDANNNLDSKSNYKIQSNVITINDVWNLNIGTLKFNPETSKIEFSNGWQWANPYASKNTELFSIGLYKSNGELIKSVQINGDNQTPGQELANAFNNLDYSYGDIIEINYKESSKISISNFNGQKNYEVTKPISLEITKDGLKELSNNLTVNPIYYELNSNKTNVSGKTTANTLVNVWVDGKDYTTTSNSNGEYNLNITADNNITSSTKITVFVAGEDEQILNPILNPNTYKIENNTIIINNVWNYSIGTLKFNPETSKIEFSNGWQWANPYASKNTELFSIGLYKSNGELIKSVQINGDNQSPGQELANAFNNLDYSYGDIIEINYRESSKISISNFNGQKNYEVTKPISLEITKDGLKELSNNLTVNPVYYELNSNKINVSGKTTANTLVNIWVDNKDYTTTSNSNGVYNLNIEANNDITSSTKINVFANGESGQFLNPVLNPNIYKIQNSVISINNGWGSPAGTITFNPVTMKMNISGYNLYLGHNSNKFLTITTYDGKTGKEISYQSFNGNDNTNVLGKYIDNKSFEYGEIIGISYDSSQGKVSVINNSKNIGNTNGNTEFFEITQDGLEPCNMPQIQVNPFDVLGNGKVTSGVISGKTNKPNQSVNVIVDGKTFSGKSDSNGNFSINISDNNGFTNSMNIVVETPGELAKVINPTADSKLGILNSNILVHGEDGVIAQEISFNPATMAVVKSAPWGNNFAAQLINGKTGAVIASCGTADFTTATSKDNLNGAHFEYGDIISVYETKEEYYTNGSLLLLNGKTGINCVDCFKNFKITPNGLVPVANNNLTTSQVLYDGNSNMALTGKTLPDTNVTISYGSISKVVKSNSSGDFSLEIPINEAPIGSEVKVFVNNDNNENLTVKYDAKTIDINSNRIEILNNTNIPIVNIGFDAVTDKLSAVQCAGGMNYTGAFYGNSLNIKFINPKTGEAIYSFSGSKLNDINSLISVINNKPYTSGDIIEVSYNPNFVKANIYDGKTSIGNTTGAREYFEITNKGLVNLNNKFINVKPLDILSNTKVTSANIEGQAKPNSTVEVSIDGNTFKGMTNGNGDFNIPISDKGGFTGNTKIVISSEGYIPTIINPTIESNIELMNSYINFYNNNGSDGSLVSSISFNPETMAFIVNNYANSFGNGKAHYFNFDLYNNNGNKILSTSINNGSTNELTNALNGKSFNYGDIIGLSYNNTISKPVVLNGNSVLSNISGNEEYFEITKKGLVKVNFGQNAYTSSVYWNNNNLVIDSSLANGQSESILNANKKLVILNSNNQVVDSVSTSVLNNNKSNVQAIVPQSILSKLNAGENYSFALDINDQIFPIKVASNTPSNSAYLLEGNSDNILTIALAEKPMVTINNSNEITSYLNTLNSNINSAISANGNTNILTNNELNYKVIAQAFIGRIGATNLENFFNKSEANKEFINWVLNNKTAMQYYLQGTSQKGININGLQIWSDIWNKYTNSRSGFNLKLAVAVAISNATPITAWPCGGSVGSPVERYNIFETLNAEGGMLPIFRTLDVRHIMYVVNTWVPNSDILETRAIIMQNHNGYINANNSGLNNIAYTIHYEEHNPHNGASIFGPDFYGKDPSPLTVWYDGGVCGSISKMGSIACQIFGIPAQPVGQPGHCAFIFYNNNHQWNIGNNIFGWSQSNGADISGWSEGIATNGNITNYDLLYNNADTPALKESNEYLWLASSDLSYQDKMNAINEAIKIQPLNLRAWLDKITLMKTNNNLTAQDYINLSNEIISTFKDYPMPMFDTLLQIKNEILQKGTTENYNSYVNAIKNALNSVTNSQQKPIAQNMLKLMKQEDLVNNAIPSIGEIVLDSWGRNTDNISFRNGTISANGSHTWVGSSNSDGININLYSPNLDLVKSFSATGEEFGADQPGYDLSGEINGTKYNIGDIISINYNPGSASHGKLYLENKEDVINEIPNNVVYKITNNGLIPLSGTYTTPSGIKYNIVNGKIAKGQISLNTWGTIGTDVLTFDGGVINASGQHRWIGSNNNDKISIDLCDSQGNLIKSFTATGEEFGAYQPGYDLSGQINGTKYNNGDIIFINYDGGEKAHGTLTYSNGVNNVKTINNQSAFIIEGNELIPITGVKKINGKVYNFNN